MMMTQMLNCVRFTHRINYKVVVTIDDLDRCPYDKVGHFLFCCRPLYNFILCKSVTLCECIETRQFKCYAENWKTDIPLHYKQVKSVLEAISILLSDRSSPFICLIAVDCRVAVKCIEQDMGDILLKANLTGYEYLKKIINLPFCIPEVKIL